MSLAPEPTANLFSVKIIIENQNQNEHLIKVITKIMKQIPSGDQRTHVAALLILSNTKVGFHFPSWTVHT
jgi:hypothetical protein